MSEENSSNSDNPICNNADVISPYFYNTSVINKPCTPVIRKDNNKDLGSYPVASEIYYYECELVQKLIQSSDILQNTGVEYVYNPIDYAMDVHVKFLNRYCNGPKKLLFLGMNPGPWGMMQTGIPFGEVNIVRDWLKLNGTIKAPTREHPAKQVTGFNCHRSEISGKRLWELVKQISNNNPLNFFKHSFIYNYFPLGLLSKTGINITPAEFKANEQKSIHIPCDEALYKIIQLLKIEAIIAVGRFAEKRATAALKVFGASDVKKINTSPVQIISCVYEQ